MTIRYLILVHDNPSQLVDLLQALDGAETDVVIHLDRKTDSAPFQVAVQNFLQAPGKHAAATPRSVAFVPDSERVRINWGGWSMIEATLAMIRVAVASDEFAEEDRLVLLSGDSYPTQPQPVIREYFLANPHVQFINSQSAEQSNKPISRVAQFHLEYDPRHTLQSIFPRLINRFRIPRNYIQGLGGRDLYFGSQWWMLSGKAVTWILSEVDHNPGILQFCRFTRVPDEFFFHTLLGNSEFTTDISRSLMYSSWTEASGASPEVLGRGHIEHLLAAGLVVDQRGYGRAPALFVRKVKDPELAGWIRSDLWNVRLTAV